MAARSRYDVILDAVGRRKSAKALLRAGDALAPGGKSIFIDDDFPKIEVDNLLLIRRLAESGELTIDQARIAPPLRNTLSLLSSNNSRSSDGTSG